MIFGWDGESGDKFRVTYVGNDYPGGDGEILTGCNANSNGKRCGSPPLMRVDSQSFAKACSWMTIDLEGYLLGIGYEVI